MKPTDIPQHSPHVSYEKVGEEAILIDLNSGSYYSLNDTGTLFWELIDGQRTIGDSAHLLAQKYAVEAAVVEADLLELATQFKQEGLIIV